MTDDISPNKLNDSDRRRIERIRSRLRSQGIGKDEALRRATAEVVEQGHGGRGGGGNAGGEPQSRGGGPQPDRPGPHRSDRPE